MLEEKGEIVIWEKRIREMVFLIEFLLYCLEMRLCYFNESKTSILNIKQERNVFGEFTYRNQLVHCASFHQKCQN